MTNQGGNLPGPNEFIETWRKAAADAEQRWNEFFNELMGTEAFGQMMARSMDSYLAVQSTFARGMEQYLRAMNIPTRTDLTQLAERVALLEQKIDTLATMLGGPAAIEPATDAGGKRRRGGRGKQRSGDGRQASEQ